MRLPTCVLSFSPSRLSSAYVGRKDTTSPTLLVTRNLCAVRRRVRSDLVLRVPESPKKVRTEKHCNLCKKHGGAYTTHNTRDCCRFEKDGTEKVDFRAAKKGRKKPSPTKQSFAQLSEKLDKLEKVLKKRDTKKRKRRRSDSDSDSK